MTAPLHTESRPRLGPGVRLREDKVRGIWTLLGPETVVEANPIAVEVLKRLDGDATLAQVVADLAETFAGDPARIETDVRDLVTKLVQRGLVEP